MVAFRSLWLLLPRPLRQLPADLAAVVVLVVATNVAALAPVIRETPLRVPLGLAFVLFVPGYAFIAALFPGRRVAGTVRRAGHIDRSARRLGVPIRRLVRRRLLAVRDRRPRARRPLLRTQYRHRPAHWARIELHALGHSTRPDRGFRQRVHARVGRRCGRTPAKERSRSRSGFQVPLPGVVRRRPDGVARAGYARGRRAERVVGRVGRPRGRERRLRGDGPARWRAVSRRSIC